MTRRSLATGIRLSAVSAACLASLGIYLPFFPIWLQHRGLDPSTIGMLVSIPIVVRIMVTASLLGLVDRGLEARRLLLVSHLGVALAAAALFWTNAIAAIAALVVVMAVAQAPLLPASDLATTDAVRRDRRLDYGRIRVWGSVSFLACNVAGGYILGATTPEAVLWLLVGVSLAAVLIVPLAPPTVREREGAQSLGPPAAAVRERFPAALWYVIAAAACIQASHGALYAFGSIAWRDQGFTDAAIGYLWATGVLAEIVMFALFGGVVGRPSGTLGLLVVGALAAMGRFALMAAEPGLAVTFGLQVMHGLSFGATHIGTMVGLARLAPAAARGRAQGLSSTAIALATAVTTLASGWLFRAVDAWVFAAMAPIAGIGLLFAVLAIRALMAQPQRDGEGG